MLWYISAYNVHFMYLRYLIFSNLLYNMLMYSSFPHDASFVSSEWKLLYLKSIMQCKNFLSHNISCFKYSNTCQGTNQFTYSAFICCRETINAVPFPYFPTMCDEFPRKGINFPQILQTERVHNVVHFTSYEKYFL